MLLKDWLHSFRTSGIPKSTCRTYSQRKRRLECTPKRLARFESLEERVVMSGPQVASLQLLNDTGVSNSDGITTDPTISGDLDNIGNWRNVLFEVDLDGNGTADGADWVSSGGLFTYTPQNLTPGPVTIAFRGYDEEDELYGAWTSFSFTLESSGGGSNAAPTAVNDAVTTDELTAVTVDLLANDSDPENDALTITAVDGNGTYGTVVDNLDGTITYTPNPSLVGTQPVVDTINYTVEDASGNSDTAVLSVTVNPVIATGPQVVSLDLLNDTGVSDSDGVTTDPTITGDLDNFGSWHNVLFEIDVDSDGIADHSGFVNSGGLFTYTTPNLAAGSVTLSVRGYDEDSEEYGDWSSISFTLEAGGANYLPNAVDDAASTDEITSVTVDLLANDNDPEQGVLTITDIAPSGSYGTLVDNLDGTVTYTPTPSLIDSAIVEDAITYTIEDDAGNTATATLYITISPKNTVAAADEYFVLKHGTLLVGAAEGVLLNDTGDDVPLVASLLDGPDHGTIILNPNGSFVYLPDAGFVGDDTFTYEATETTGANATGTVTIHVQSPVATDDSYAIPYYRRLKAGAFSHATEAGPMEVSVLANDQAVDDETLSAVIVSGPANGQLLFDRDGSFIYTPDEAFIGTDAFTYRLTGDGFESNVATVSISVENFLAATVDDTYTVLHDTSLAATASVSYEPGPEEEFIVTSGVLANDTDEDGDWLTAVLVSGPSHGTLVLESNGTFVYTPDIGFVGQDSFIYVANDGLQDSAAATVTIDVVGPAYVAVDDSFNVSHDGYLMSELVEDPDDPEAFILTGPDLLANDELDGSYTFQAALVTDVTHGTLVLEANGVFTYTPDAGFTGVDSFTYQITDGVVVSNVATVAINVINDAPTANDDSYTMQRGYGVIGGLDDATGLVNWTAGANLLENDGNSDEDFLTAVLVSGPTNGTLDFYGDGTFAYRPNAGFAGSDSFTYKVSDGITESAAATVTLIVTNSAPSAVGESFTVTHDDLLVLRDSAYENTPGTPALIANDTDPDGDRLEMTVVTGPTNGTLVWEANGTFTYSPGAGFVGTDSFTYQVSDGIAVSGLATVTIDVVNDAPVAADNTYNIGQGQLLIAGRDDVLLAAQGLLQNDTDAQGDKLTASLVTGPTDGVLTWYDNGRFVYQPDAGFYGTDSFEYTVSDGLATSNVATVTINVGYTPPTITDDEFTVANDQVLVVGNGGSYFTGIFSDEANETTTRLVATIVTGPAHGTLTDWLDNGTFTYTPDAGYVGDDTITLSVDDGVRDDLTATVTIHVAAASGIADTTTPEHAAASAAFRTAMIALEAEWESFVAGDKADQASSEQQSLIIQAAWKSAYDAAETEFQTQVAASEATYFATLNEAEANFAEVLAALTETNTAAIQAADADLLAEYAANDNDYWSEVAAAESTYAAAVAAADRTLREAHDGFLVTYSDAMAAADATYDAAVTSLGLAVESAVASEQAVYENAEEASWDAYQTALAAAQTTYQSAVDAAVAARDSVLAQYPDIIYNPGAVDTDASFTSVVAAADATLDTAIDTADANYLASVTAGIGVYDTAIGAAEAAEDAATDAAALAYTAAIVTADDALETAKAAADAAFDADESAAAAVKSAAIIAADTAYEAAAAAAQAAFDQAVAEFTTTDIEGEHEASLFTVETTHQQLFQDYYDQVSAERGANEDQLELDREAAEDAYDAATAAAVADYIQARDPINAAAEAAKQSADAQYSAATNATKIAYATEVAVYWGSPYGALIITLAEARKAYEIASADADLDRAVSLKSIIITSTSQERAAFVDKAEAIADAAVAQAEALRAATEDYAYEHLWIEWGRIPEDAQLAMDRSIAVEQLWSEMQVALATQERNRAIATNAAQETLDKALADAQKIKDEAVAAAEHVYALALAEAGRQQAYAYAAAEQVYTGALAQAASAQVAAEAAAGNTLAKAAADAQRTLDTVYIDAQTAYVGEVTTAALTWASTVTSGRGNAMAAQYDSPDNTPEENQLLAAQTAVADAWSTYQMSIVQARVDRLVAENTARAARLNTEADAWKQSAYEVADEAEAHANQVASAGVAWAGEAAQADRQHSESSADGHKAWVISQANAEQQFALDEAESNKNRAHKDAVSAHQNANTQADNELQSQTTYWSNHMVDYVRRAEANRIHLTNTMEAQAWEEYNKALADAERVEEEAKDKAQKFKNASLRDKDLAIQTVTTGLADSVNKAHERLDTINSQPIEYFEAQVSGWGNVVHWIQHDSVDWIINDGLDMATDFFVGAADGLTLGYFTTIVNWATEDRLLAHVNQDSWSYFAGNMAGMAVSFIISGAGTGGAVAGHVGWAYYAAKGYAYTASAVGVGESVYHMIRGEATWTDALNLVPLAGAYAGKVTRGLGVFKCFVGDTPVVVGYEMITTQAVATPATGYLSPYCGVACIVIACGGRWLLGDRKQKARDQAILEFDHFEGGDDANGDNDKTLSPRIDNEEIDELCEMLFHGQSDEEIELGHAATMTMTAAKRKQTAPLSEPMTIPLRSEAMTVTKPVKPATRPKRAWLAKTWLIAWMMLGGLCLWQGSQGATDKTTSPPVQSQVAITRPIQEIGPGQKVVAENPLGLETEPSNIEPVFWRQLTLRLEKDAGGWVDINLLRPLDWLEDHQAVIGKTIKLNLPEMGAAGDAMVMGISPCPQIEASDGRVVTGTFAHSAGDVIDVFVEGETNPVGTTHNHPFWSEDRREFIPAEELRPGETLRTVDGRFPKVTAIHPRPGTHEVFNLEVDVEHVYHVTAGGVLVHNSYVVYRGVNNNGELYVGITNNLARRAAEHRRNDIAIEAIEGLGGLTKRQARGVEQAIIKDEGLDNLLNKINSISERNPKYKSAVKFGEDLLKKIGFTGL